MRLQPVLFTCGAVLVMSAVVVSAQNGLKIGQIKPKLATAGQLVVPRNINKNIARITKNDALAAIGEATKTKPNSLEQAIAFTPDQPVPNGNTSIAGNVTMTASFKGGNWVFDEVGFVMAGVKVPSGTKYALVTANGSWSVNCKEVRITSGSTTTSLAYSTSAPEDFHHMMVIDVAGKSEVGFTVAADPGKGGRIWLGSIEVHFTK